MTELEYTGERAVPWNPLTGAHILNRHVMRYAWAVPWVYGKRVIDLGCGTGYGAFMLSWGASDVLGVDVSPDAIRFAVYSFCAPNLLYRVQDLEQGTLPAADVYVAFEVLEHLDDPGTLLDSLRARGGVLLWSLPVSNDSRFHKRVYSLAEATSLVPGSEIWYQDSVGTIVPRELSRSRPVNVVGTARLQQA